MNPTHSDIHINVARAHTHSQRLMCRNCHAVSPRGHTFLNRMYVCHSSHSVSTKTTTITIKISRIIQALTAYCFTNHMPHHNETTIKLLLWNLIFATAIYFSNFPLIVLKCHMELFYRFFLLNETKYWFLDMQMNKRSLKTCLDLIIHP